MVYPGARCLAVSPGPAIPCIPVHCRSRGTSQCQPRADIKRSGPLAARPDSIMTAFRISRPRRPLKRLPTHHPDSEHILGLNMTILIKRWIVCKSLRYNHDIFKCIFLNDNVWIPIKISLKFVPKCPINNITALVQIMAWRRPGDKPLTEPMMASLPTHICVTRPQWFVKSIAALGQWLCHLKGWAH